MPRARKEDLENAFSQQNSAEYAEASGEERALDSARLLTEAAPVLCPLTLMATCSHCGQGVFTRDSKMDGRCREPGPRRRQRTAARPADSHAPRLRESTPALCHTHVLEAALI